MRNAIANLTGLIAVFGMIVSMPLSYGAEEEEIKVESGKDIKVRVELDREVLPADKEDTAVIKVTLGAPRPPEEAERPPVNLGIVLDRSGSMSGSKIVKAREATLEALRRLAAHDLFALVSYNHNVETVVPAQSAANTNWIEERIRQIHANGNTALFGGVSQGAAEVRKNLKEEYIHRIILMSDGLANVGPSSPADLERLGAALVKEGISVTTVGVGTDYNEDLMTRLSQASDGNAYFVENSRDLPRIFAEELGDVLSVVARKVIIEIEVKDGARPVRIIGREGRIRDNKVEITLNQLYGGQEKYALIETRVPATAKDKTRTVAVARIRYENVITEEKAKAESQADAKFSDDEEVIRKNVNADVQRELYYNRIAITKDQAVELMDAGRKKEAVEALRRVQQEAEEAASMYGIEGLAPAAAEVGADAEQLEQRGMSKSDRKSFRTDSYQIRSQQK